MKLHSPMGPIGSPDIAQDTAEPVRHIPGDERTTLRDGAALCLSGGGFRAMLFHLGVLWRLNDAGYLPRLERISSVSGGSLTAGVLAQHWDGLDFDGVGVAANFASRIVEPLRVMAHHHIDIPAVLYGVARPFTSVSDCLVNAYRRHLFGDTTLQQLPERPRFVFNATNLQSGALMRFSRAFLADYRVGRVMNPDIPVAVAVAASSAFPPFLSPCTVDLSRQDWTTDTGNDLTGDEYRGRIQLTDGGVYDNLGLETVWKIYRTVLVSDGGGHFRARSGSHTDWPRHLLRAMEVMDNQVRSLRKRQVITALNSGEMDRNGMYIGIRSHVTDYHLHDVIPADPLMTAELAAIPTRLAPIHDQSQELLINWGYTICDTGLRRHIEPTVPKGALPYPNRALQHQRSELRIDLKR